MHALGTDIVMINRIKPWVKDTAMLEKVFTDSERQYCLNKRHPHKHLAAAFAVKEAFMKAIGTGWSSGVGWRDIEMLNERDRLSIRLYNKANELYGCRKVFVSTSCTGDLAIAMVVIDNT